MSAIGEYVHLNAVLYKRFGINRAQSGYHSIEAQEALNRQAQLNKQRINKFNINIDKKGIEQELNNIFSTTPSQNKERIYEIQKAIQELMNETFSNQLGKINFDTGNIENIRANTKMKIQKIKAEGKFSMHLGRIIKIIRLIEDYRDDLVVEIKDNKSLIDLNSLNKKIQLIYKQLYELINQKDTIIASMGLLKTGDINTIKQQLGSGKLPLRRTSGQNLIQLINDTLNELKVPAINLQKGTLAEYGIAAVPEMAGKIANEELKKYIDSHVKGDARSHREIKYDNFFGDFNPELYKDSFTIDETTKTMITRGTSQNKIDVILTWKGIDYKVSAKNINLNSGNNVHIVSGQSLLYLLQDENGDFINHYLNLIGSRKEGENFNFIKGHRDSYISMLLQTIFIKTLTGDTYGSDAANVFIINNNNSMDGFKVYSMKEILEDISLDGTGLSRAIVEIGEQKAFYFSNTRQSTVSARLNKILADMHKAKVNAMIKPSYFK